MPSCLTGRGGQWRRLPGRAAPGAMPGTVLFIVPAEAAGINLSKHMEVPQGGLDRRFHLWQDLWRRYALRQRPALASLGNDDLGDIPGRNLQAVLLQYPRPDFPVGGGVVRRNVRRRLVVQEDMLPAIQKFPTYGEWRRHPHRRFKWYLSQR